MVLYRDECRQRDLWGGFIELDDIVNVIEELFAGLARLVGVGARQEGFDVNIRFVQLADEVGELIFVLTGRLCQRRRTRRLPR